MSDEEAVPPDEDPRAYVGLDAEAAERQALERGWTKVRVLQPGAIVTLEYMEGRLNLTVEGGVVKDAWSG